MKRAKNKELSRKTNLTSIREKGEGEKILIPRLGLRKCPEPILRRVPSVTTIFPVSMRLTAGTRQITREQREITIWWRVFASPGRGWSRNPVL